MKKFGVLLSLVVACGGAQDDGGAPGAESEQRDGGALEQSEVCDPLQAKPLPIALGEVLAAGSARDGTIYVVTRGDTRAELPAFFGSVFVSEGDALVRRDARLDGSKPVGEDITEHSITFREGDQLSRLLFQTRGSSATRMAVARDDVHATYEDESTVRLELTLLPASALNSKPLRNLPGAVGSTYSGMTADGQQVLLTTPADAGGAARVFLGRENRLKEAPLLYYSSAVELVSAGFGVDGRLARVGFVLNGTPEFSTVLMVDSRYHELQVLRSGTPSGLPDSWTFDCL
jgi:hypothetical protein